jgi:hypothetical protein
MGMFVIVNFVRTELYIPIAISKELSDICHLWCQLTYLVITNVWIMYLELQ